MSALLGLSVGLSLIWEISYYAAMTGRMLYILNGDPRTDRLWRALARVHQELWIVAPVGILVIAVAAWRILHWYWAMPFLAFIILDWWRSRNWPDENRWKRRGKKLKDAVAERAGRLVVVPS